MVQTLLLLFRRNIWRNRNQYFPNIFGLVVAISSLFIISFSVDFSTGFDKFHDHSDRIYRVNYDETVSGRPGARYLPTTGPLLARDMMEKFPEVEYGARIRHYKNRLISTGNDSFFEDHLFYTDPEFLTMFSFELINGNRNTCLDLPNSILLTEDMALKYFGSYDILGKSLTIDENEEAIVTGVLKNVPSNSTLQFDFLLPFDAFKVPHGYPVTLQTWGWISFYNFIQLKENTDPALLEEKLPEYAASHFEPERASNMAYRLQPLEEIYLGSINNGDIPQGNLTYIKLLVGVGLVILLIAAFNFINLSIVISSLRSKESALKKIYGGSSSNVFLHTFMENTLLILICFGISALFIYSFRSIIASVIEVPEIFIISRFTLISLGLFVVSLSFGALSGIYPSIISSRFTISSLVKGRVQYGPKAGLFRKGMIGFQFSMAALLLVMSVAVLKQINFIRDKDLGYETENIVILKAERDRLRNQYHTLNNELKQVPGIIETAISGEMLDGDQGSVPFSSNDWESEEPMAINIYGVRENWIEVMDLEMISGRTFQMGNSRDSSRGVIINEETLNILGWTPEDAIGRHAVVGEIVEGEIIGVVKNFHYQSLHHPIGPLAIFIPRALVDKVTIRYDATHEEQVMAQLKQKWTELDPDQPFDPIFLSSQVENFYDKESSFGFQLLVFCLIAVGMGGVGLFGLIEFHLLRQLKEIGIRRLLGASRLNLILVMTGTFLAVVFMCSVAIVPVADVLVSSWIGNFAYRTDISIYYLLIPILILLMLAVLTVAFRVWKVSTLSVTTILNKE